MASRVKLPNEGKPFWKPAPANIERDRNGFPVGPRTKERRRQNKKLNENLVSIKGFCEIKLAGCLGNRFLTWAHSKKSRFIVSDWDWQEAARACISCHRRIEEMSHDEMHKIITTAIARRKK
jgi:hypothetical protein